MEVARCKHKLPKVDDFELFAALVAVGTAAWVAISVGARAKDAWDSQLYFVAALPAFVALSALYGWRAPRRAWCWPVVLALGQAIGAAMLSSERLARMPKSLGAIALLSLPSLIAALTAARLRLRRV